MTMRSRRETVHFRHPFQIKEIDRVLPPGAYEVITNEEMIEGPSFAAFRSVANLIVVPAAASLIWKPSRASARLNSCGCATKLKSVPLASSWQLSSKEVLPALSCAVSISKHSATDVSVRDIPLPSGNA
jgi:hypothetical protein